MIRWVGGKPWLATTRLVLPSKRFCCDKKERFDDFLWFPIAVTYHASNIRNPPETGRKKLDLALGSLQKATRYKARKRIAVIG